MVIIMLIEGNIHIMGDNVDTDVIIPGRYLSLTDPKEIAKRIFEGVEPEFVKRVKPGDIIVAGRNFGSGSSREHAVIGLKALGIAAIVAKSFARIFYRNAINIGLPIFISPQLVEFLEKMEIRGVGSFIKSTDLKIRIYAESGEIEFLDKKFKSTALPTFIQDIIASGGIIEWAKKRLGK